MEWSWKQLTRQERKKAGSIREMAMPPHMSSIRLPAVVVCTVSNTSRRRTQVPAAWAMNRAPNTSAGSVPACIGAASLLHWAIHEQSRRELIIGGIRTSARCLRTWARRLRCAYVRQRTERRARMAIIEPATNDGQRATRSSVNHEVGDDRLHARRYRRVTGDT